MSSGRMRSSRLVPLGDTGWAAWPQVLVRSAGFPVQGVTAFAAPDLAASVDADLPPQGRAPADLAERIEQGYADQRGTLVGVAGDPVFREAVTWQNPGALVALDRVTDQAKDGTKRRQSDRLVARYWQRYCTKNETIGFFGPAVWGRFADQDEPTRVQPGGAVVRDRRVCLEDWALAALAEAVADLPAVREDLPVRGGLHRAAVGRPGAAGRVAPSPLEAHLLETADGTPRGALLDRAVADGAARTRADADLALDRLRDRGLVQTGFDVPAHPSAEGSLLTQVAALSTEGGALARALLEPVLRARSEVAAAAGDAERLGPALARLAEAFEAATGVSAGRRAGQTYAGRSLCYEETTRDVDIAVSPQVLEPVSGALALLLDAATWLCEELATRYTAALTELAGEVAADRAEFPLAELWFFAQGALFGAGERPADAVSAEFRDRWARLIGVTPQEAADPSVPVQRRSADLAPAAAQLFALRAGPLRWSASRLHSPDLQVVADSVQQVRDGRHRIVLGELHAGWATFDSGAMTASCLDTGPLREALARDLGTARLRLLYPDGWPRFTGRLSTVLHHDTDHWLSFTAPTRGEHVLPGVLTTSQLRVVRGADGWRVLRPDDRAGGWSLVEAFSDLLATQAVDAWKVTSAAPASPAVEVDGLVVTRSTRRLTCQESGLVDVTSNADRYVAVRRLRHRLGLGERVFVTLASETKPVFVDLTSPVYAAMLAAMVRAASLGSGPQTALTVTEMVPGPDDCFLTDDDGRAYVSELRLHCVPGESATGRDAGDPR